MNGAIPPARPDLDFEVAADTAINYAFQQNAIPVIRELRIRNNGLIRRNVLVRISTEPDFAMPVEIRLQALEANGEFRTNSVDLKLSHDYLATLNERVSGWLKIDASSDGTALGQHTRRIDLLARNEWCGLVSLPEILAAFVLPNDPAVMKIMDRAAELLKPGNGSLNGYQDKSRKRAWDQAAAIYKALAELDLRYISPPASFEQTGQKVRFPSEIVSQRFGTCLDLTLMYAACCEQAGLRPLIVMHQGHAYAGCWLSEKSFPEPVIDDLQHLRKLATDELVIVVETTALTSSPDKTLEHAELLAQPHLVTEAPFRIALDVHRARTERIHPLPIPGAPVSSGSSMVEQAPRSAGIGSRGFSTPEEAASESPQRPTTRIDQWKSRLLDLTLRNRLLNFRETRQTVRLLSAASAHVEDELAANQELSLRPNPRVMAEDDPRSSTAYMTQRSENAWMEHLRDELRQGRLHTDLQEAEHTRRLTELYRSARNDIEENGTNTLFAAVGMLEWKEAEHGDRVLRAPLLLVPVEIKRKSVAEGFTLRRIDEETRLNVTLIEMLRQVFAKEIPGLDPLPEDHSGVDVPLVFGRFREAIRDLRGWEVHEEVWLGQFSFTKFLLWKDLSDRLDALTQNRVVHHLVHEAGTPYPNVPDDIRPDELDDRFHPREVFCPRSADSSQLAAVMAAAAGHDFVLEGPPGTGKSQTITNIIAHCLAHGKKVLFVAEKRAALDVVHRRLREEGLEPFCLELHSNKTGKGDVLAQFERSLKAASETTATDWDRHTTELARIRSELNGYTRSLHRPAGCGISAYACLDYLLPRKDDETVRFGDDYRVLEVSIERLESSRRVVRALQERSRSLLPLSSHPLASVACEEWSPVWAERMPPLISGLAGQAEAASEPTRALLTWLRFPAPTASRDTLLKLSSFAECLLSPLPVAGGFAAEPWPETSQKLSSWISVATQRAAARKRLNGYNEGRLLALDLDSLSSKLASARNAWFIVKWLRIGGVRRQLRAARTDNTKPAVETMADILADAILLRKTTADIRSATPVAMACLGPVWANGEPDPATLASTQRWGEQLHTRLLACAGDNFIWLAQAKQILAALFSEGPAAYAPGTVVGRRIAEYRTALEKLDGQLEAVTRELQLKREPVDAAPDLFSAVRATAEQLLAGWPKIREWCLWQKARREARELGLGTVVARMEAGPTSLDVPALFECSFRRALLFAITEREQPLRDFFGREQDERIEQFRSLDGRIASLSRQLIRGRLAAGVPRDQPVPEIPKPEIGLLRKELGKKARHIPVRRLLAGIPNLLPRLKPCVLMSPLSVAQYLEASHDKFDVVIFDEASQIPVWDAVGAIARGKQLIVVGDPKQLPPTNFFAANPDDDDSDHVPEEYKDLESVLDELLSHQMRHKRLNWHYRSRHEGLITFSNRQYYDNDLLTFPSPDTRGGGVRFNFLSNARYDKGKSRTNRAEAEALVKELVSRLCDKAAPTRSYGVVTFSQAQQALVENLLDEERRKHPEIEPHFGDAPPVEGEPVFVKNLENVQGDERDVILFSICYAPDEAGKVSMNFGPLNRDGGERRLNVAITRAKHEVVVFSGLRADQIDLTRTRARGVRDLKYFLDYAERGPSALSAATSASGEAEPESEFERLVADSIRKAGYEVHHQVGCSGYRIDLGVVDPHQAGRYLLGVECDGATYHRAATARDRDKLRQAVLEGLGWKLHRIWSTDWWHNPESEFVKLREALSDAAENGSNRPSN